MRRLSERENQLRTIRGTNPDWMPYSIGFNLTAWDHLGDELDAVILRHPRTWPNWRKGAFDWKNSPCHPAADPDAGEFIDPWGTAWRTTTRGIMGCVVRHAIEDLARMDDHIPPDPAKYSHLGPIDWDEHRQAMDREKAAGHLAVAGPEHGFHLLRLEYLVGFENLMCELAENTPRIRRLVEKVHAFNKSLVTRMIDTGAEAIGFAEDLGMQTGSILGPALFRKWVTPYYRELHALAHARGCLTLDHSDGNIMDVADQILEFGVDAFNPQDRLNGVDNLAKAFKGRLCIDLDFDRQHTLPFGTRRDIEALVEHEVRTLGSAQGGLSIIAGIYGDVPAENIDALATALEKWSTFWFDQR